MRFISKKVFFSFTLVFIFIAAYVAFAWTEPVSAPPTGNVPSPINTSLTTQTKNGGLNVMGNVGIGTTNPIFKLDVQGDIRSYTTDLEDAIQGFSVDESGIVGGSTNGMGVFGYTSSGSNPALRIQQNGTGDIAQFFDGGTQSMTIQDGGKVGIGTTTPNATLEVNGGVRLKTIDVKPACDNANGPNIRGLLWFTRAGPGTEDKLAVCRKSNSDTYSWENLN